MTEDNFKKQLEWDYSHYKRMYDVFEKHPINITYIVDALEKYTSLIDVIGPEVLEVALKELKQRRGL